MKSQFENITNLFFEWGVLSRMDRSGPALAQIDNPDSLADHTVRTALIAFVLAEMEGADPYKTAVMALIHDLGEIRVGDQNKVSARYLKMGNAEQKAFLDQIKILPGNVKKAWRKLYQENEERTSWEGVIARDADWLENAVSSKEYISKGYKSMQDWIDNIKKALETDSAKKLLAEIEKTEPTDWWKGLKKMTHKKLPKTKINKLRPKADDL